MPALQVVVRHPAAPRVHRLNHRLPAPVRIERHAARAPPVPAAPAPVSGLRRNGTERRRILPRATAIGRLQHIFGVVGVCDIRLRRGGRDPASGTSEARRGQCRFGTAPPPGRARIVADPYCMGLPAEVADIHPEWRHGRNLDLREMADKVRIAVRRLLDAGIARKESPSAICASPYRSRCAPSAICGDNHPDDIRP